MKLDNPFILQRADPHISRHNGSYYFTASVPEYDRLILRRSRTLAGLAHAEELTVWHAPETGPASALIWAPELHHGGDAWYLYFAAAPSREIKDQLFQHRMYALRNPSRDPMQGDWHFAGQVDSGLDTFCLDATSFEHRGQRYYLWAQKHPEMPGNSNLYLARLQTPTQIIGPPVMLSRPEFDWEGQGFMVNEGPAVLIRSNWRVNANCGSAARRFSPATPLMSAAAALKASMLPYSPSHFAAVLGPTLATPGTLSTASPISIK